MPIAAALQLALALTPAADHLVLQLASLIHGGANLSDPTPAEIETEIVATNMRLDQAQADANGIPQL